MLRLFAILKMGWHMVSNYKAITKDKTQITSTQITYGKKKVGCH